MAEQVVFIAASEDLHRRLYQGAYLQLPDVGAAVAEASRALVSTAPAGVEANCKLALHRGRIGFEISWPLG